MTELEFNKFIEDSSIKIQEAAQENQLLEYFIESIKNFIPSDIIKIFKINHQDSLASSMELDGKSAIAVSLDSGGAFSHSYQFKQSLIINDIKSSMLYNNEVDSLGFKSLSRILILPILENREPKRVISIVWIAMEKGLIQFIQQDLENLQRFANIIKNKLFFGSTNIEDSSLSACREYRRELQAKIERLKSSYASTIHDVRTPMNAIIGFMELLRLGEKDKQNRDYIDAALKSSEHIVALINDALDISKVTSGKMTLHKTDFSPMVVLSDIAKLFYNSMKKKGLIFDIYIDPKMPQIINSDLNRIKQIISNLLSNALKFTPIEGKVTMGAYFDNAKSILSIIIKDSGIGIDKGKQKDIFTPYKQETSATASEYGGTGLGLAISQQLSILLNGWLTLESEKSKGSKFEFILPCDIKQEKNVSYVVPLVKEKHIYICISDKRSDSTRVAKRYIDDIGIQHVSISNISDCSLDIASSVLIINKESALNKIKEIELFLKNGGSILFVEDQYESSECQFEGKIEVLKKPILPLALFESLNILIDPSLKAKESEDIFGEAHKLVGHSVLVVDDNMINLKLMSEIFKRFNLEVVSCVNPREGLKKLENRYFDFMFIDEHMPIMDGNEMIAKIRKNEKDKKLKPSTIFALTGTVEDETLNAIRNAGADGIYEKPVHIEDIYKALINNVK